MNFSFSFFFLLLFFLYYSNSYIYSSSSSFFTVLRVLRVVRFFRVLRPLKSLKYFKGIFVFVESLAYSSDILLITTVIFMTAMIALAFLTNSFIGDLLLNRCIPAVVYNSAGVRDLPLNSTARADSNYIAYGADYFFSSYNLNYCKDRYYFIIRCFLYYLPSLCPLPSHAHTHT